MNKEQKNLINSKTHNWLYTLLYTVFSLESFGRHLVGNRFPSILRYWRPRNLVLKPDKTIYKWLWWYFVPKHGGITTANIKRCNTEVNKSNKT